MKVLWKPLSIAFLLCLCQAGAPLNLFQANSSLTCEGVQEIPKADQCQYVKTHCDSEDHHLGIFNYIEMYYCAEIRFFPATAIFSSLVLSFISLGLTASDYLCPNLYSISKFLDLSDNLAGLTLLAIGNGSPDILGTYKALSIGSAGLAISELMGAAFFIVTVVTGSICIVRPFKVPKYHLMRDVLFYTVVCLLFWASLMAGQFNFVNSTILASVYVVYVFVAVYSNRWLRKNTRKKVAEARIMSRYDDLVLVTMEDDMDQSYFNHISSLPTIDVLSTSSDEMDPSDEFGNYLKTHPHDASEERAPIETGTYGLRVLLRELSKHSIHAHSTSLVPRVQWLTDDRPMTAPAATLLTTDHDTHHYLAFRDTDNLNDIISTANANFDDNIGAANANSDDNINNTNRNESDFDVNGHEENTPSDEDTLKTRLVTFVMQFLPDYGADTLFGRFMYFVCAPTNVVLKLTTPTREQAIEYGEHCVSSSNAFTFQNPEQGVEDNFCDYDFRSDVHVFRIQMVVGPMILMLMLFHPFGVIHVIAFLVAAGVTLLIPVHEPKFERHMLRYRALNYLGSFIGFGLSLLWISIFATEIIAVIKTIALVLQLSDDILGSTVFALGNSIGDLVSNLTVAGMGMPVMAFGACFGGPLLSLCALGVSSMLVMSDHNSTAIKVAFSPTLHFNLTALLVSQIFILVFVPRNGWMFDRKLGIILISFWVVTTVATILMEVK